MTQWGPEYLKNADGSRLKEGTTRAKVESFVRYAANDKLFWVGPLPGVDPWHTFLTYKDSVAAALKPAREALIKRGVEALALNSAGIPIRPQWPASMPLCAKGTLNVSGINATEVVLAVLGLAVGAAGAVYFNRWLAGEKVV